MAKHAVYEKMCRHLNCQKVLTFIFALLVLGSHISSSSSSLSSFSSLDSNDPYSWIVKSVCADNANDLSLNWDPYYPCPSNSYIRKLKVGEKFTYSNYEQTGNQISDSFSLLDAQGNPLYIHTFDYYPFNQFNQHSGSDGYDVYHIDDNHTVSYSNTKDGGGFGSTFFGDKCEFGNGWVLFPKLFLSDDDPDGGEGFWPISGVYWEQTGSDYPGACPSGYSRNTQTLWELLPSFEFGGINNNPLKFMDTLVSYHGYETDDGVNPTANFLQQGHLEVFYFTKEYGITRWEVWAPIVDSSYKPTTAAMAECSGSLYGSYKSGNFTKIACHDWSNVKILDKPVLPAWPIVNSNLLKHFHFDSPKCLSDNDGLQGVWHRFGSTINWGVEVSSGGSDNNNGDGITYLTTNCGSTCGQSGSQAIFQDISISSMQQKLLESGGLTILYGVNARISKNETGVGTLQVVLQVLNSDKNQVLWQDVTTCDNLTADNGDGRSGESDSEYLSSKFIHNVVNLPALSESTVNMRFLIIPTTLNTFNIIDSFVNPFPTAN